ncbi:hypothetical protein [Williamsia sp.]|uniref:hypothetical protein n=1 Tax=Williamsia sp. TaxID=1872085 RepID=UPI002F925BD1
MSAGRLVIWRGVDGSVWHLHGPRMGEEGVFLTSFAGLYHPVRVPLDERPAYMAGARPGIPKTDPRVIDMKIFTSAETEEGWEEVEERWWDSWSDEQDGTLEVYNHRGQMRDIDLRLQKYPSEPFDFEPEEVFDWTMPTIAYGAWFRGPIMTSKWTNTDGTGEGVLRMANPGDVEIWPQFAGRNLELGEIYTVPDGIAGDSLPLPDFSPEEGDWLVDTDQFQIQLEDMGNSQAIARMAAMKFQHAIPAKTKVPVEVPVSVEGGTTAAEVKAYMRPLYRRPF